MFSTTTWVIICLFGVYQQIKTLPLAALHIINCVALAVLKKIFSYHKRNRGAKTKTIYVTNKSVLYQGFVTR